MPIRCLRLDIREDVMRYMSILAGSKSPHITGRSGMFRYYNMDHAIESGTKTAERIIKKKFKMKNSCRQIGTKGNEIVIPACRESFLRKDAGQVRYESLTSMTPGGFSGEMRIDNSSMGS